MWDTHSNRLLLDYTPVNYFNLMSIRKTMNFYMKWYYMSINHSMNKKLSIFSFCVCIFYAWKCNENIRTLNLIIMFFVKSNLKKSTLLLRLTVHASLCGFLRIWAFKNDKKVTHLTVHAPIPGYRCMHCYARGNFMSDKWVNIKFIQIWALMSGLDGQTEFKKATNA